MLSVPSGMKSQTVVRHTTTTNICWGLVRLVALI